MTNAVSDLFELCQQAQIKPPLFKFPTAKCCVVEVDMVGVAEGQNDVKHIAKQLACAQLLESEAGQKLCATMYERYLWTDVRNKSRDEVAHLMQVRAFSCAELLRKPGYSASKYTEIRNRCDRLTKQMGVLLVDFEKLTTP